MSQQPKKRPRDRLVYKLSGLFDLYRNGEFNTSEALWEVVGGMEVWMGK